MGELSANTATGNDLSLSEQIMQDDMTALGIDGTNGQGEAGSPQDKPPGENTAGEEKVETPEPTAEEPKEEEPATPEGDQEETPEAKPEGETTEPPKDPAAPHSEPKLDAPLKIGTREFATVTDAVQEATRVLGHNAKLAGDVKLAERRIADAETKATEAETRAKELTAANQQWAEWHKKHVAGEAAGFAPGHDPEAIARRTVDELETRRTEEERQVVILKDLGEIEATSNYAEIAELFTQVSDKVNPLTGKYFMPKEAYDFACKQLGKQNLLDAPTPLEQIRETAKPAEPPAPVATKKPLPLAGKNAKVIASSAARPANAGSRGGGTTPEWSFEDEALSEAFPTH